MRVHVLIIFLTHLLVHIIQKKKIRLEIAATLQVWTGIARNSFSFKVQFQFSLNELFFHNYFRELSSTFIKLCDLVDAAKKKVENEISKLSDEIADLEKIESQARLLGLVSQSNTSRLS